MSGIFGIFNLNQRPVTRPDLDKIRGAMAHRGLDGSGLFLDENLGLGHLKTCFTPESTHENLPYCDNTSELTITADARIDNRDQLFSCLSIARSQRNTTPDSILILKAYEKWGEDCPQYLLGEYAFAIWNKKKKCLFCARDHIGFRPFFYHYCQDYFVFSSEIKGIRSLKFIPQQFNETALAQHLLHLEPDHQQTFFKDILRLGCAQSITLSQNQKIRIQRYWTPEPLKDQGYSSDKDYAEALRDIIIRSVSCRLRTNFPVSVSLSGGVDSSAVACIAARILREKGQSLIAVSSVLPKNHQGIETDERHYIQAILDQEPNIDIHYITAPGKGPFDFSEMHRGIEQVEAPIPSVFYMSQALCQTAKDKGARGLLSGRGGDMMASYDGQDALYRLYKEFRWLAFFKLLRQLCLIENKGYYRILKNYFVKSLVPPELLNLIILAKTITNEKPRTPMGAINPEFSRQYGTSPSKRLGYYKLKEMDCRQFTSHRIQNGKFINDESGIRASFFNMESLSPLFDKRILDFFMATPTETFFMGEKKRGLFRHAMEGILPPLVQWRHDKGAFIPDFHQRVIAKQQVAIAFLESLGKDDPARKYLDINFIIEQFKHVAPVKNRGQWETRTQKILTNNICLINFLHWINKEIKQ